MRLITTAPAAETSSRSWTGLLTAGLNWLVAVTVMVSLTPTLVPPGTATRASRDAAAPEASGTGPVSSTSPPSRTPLPFASRYRVTGHPRLETAATVNESAPFPTFVRVCAKVAAAPGAALVARGGCSVTPATCPTRNATVSEGAVYPVPPMVKERVAQFETWVPAGVPWACNAGAASSPAANTKAAAQTAAARPRRANRLRSTAGVPSRIGDRPLS